MLKALALKPERATDLEPADRNDRRVVSLAGCCIVMVPCCAEVMDPRSSSPRTCSSSMGNP